MTGSTRRPCDEAPVFTGLDATSFTYAFEMKFGRHETDARGQPCFVEDGDHRAAFRLRRISKALDSLRKDNEAAYKRLIEPVRSFLDDVTMGHPGTNGRPLLFAASPAQPEAESRRVWAVRPKNWTYEFESSTTRLYVPPARRLLPLRLRDTFCVFESGRVFYLLTLTQDAKPGEDDDDDVWPDPDTPLAGNTEEPEAPDEPDSPRLIHATDEYGVLQFQQLVFNRNAASGDARYLGFAHRVKKPALAAIDDGTDADYCSLVDLAEHRLRALEQAAAGGADNGISCVLAPYHILPRGTSGTPLDRARFTTGSLQRLCVAIESDEMLRVSELTHCLYDADARPKPALRAEKQGPEVLDIAPVNTAWSRRYLTNRRGKRRPHASRTELYDRTSLAFAGLAQGVPDFPWQDESEVFDSTRPTYFSVESSHYVHPRFVLEVAKSWRSYEQARPEIGTCPYLLLMFMVAIHDELVVSEMEREIDDMVYADSGDAPRWWRRGHGTKQDERFRVIPLRGVLQVLRDARRMGGSGAGIIETNLTRRFELFRWSSVQRSGNIFRYSKERGALTAIQEAMGTSARFDRAHATVDRMESLIEDVSSLKDTYANQRTNWLLFVLTLVSIVSLPKAVAELLVTVEQGKPTSPNYGWVIGAMLALLGGWFLVNLRKGIRRRQERRISKSS